VAIDFLETAGCQRHGSRGLSVRLEGACAQARLRCFALVQMLNSLRYGTASGKLLRALPEQPVPPGDVLRFYFFGHFFVDFLWAGRLMCDN
ncbi:uncharacterized protein METZ01_LOCUS150556, partial [marine metagenome]